MKTEWTLSSRYFGSNFRGRHACPQPKIGPHECDESTLFDGWLVGPSRPARLPGAPGGEVEKRVISVAVALAERPIPVHAVHVPLMDASAAIGAQHGERHKSDGLQSATVDDRHNLIHQELIIRDHGIR